MIALDTNVLLRYLLHDDPLQTIQTSRLFEDNDCILITDIVLAEAVWTLRGKRYNAQKAEIVTAINALLHNPKLEFESRESVWSALLDYANAPPVITRSGVRHVDFQDALIIQKAQVVMAAWSEPYEATYTFDLAAQSLEGTKAP
ncbi:PIN domain-containing protein [Pseudoduganella aquatica]|uniref:PIN domain-containing protein n=1 Tax=Pseudoduganella aquatica TaxID=2660641 RepID=A0A7X4KNU9_9BURK|nr:type II toxin-antitoxin system VapC family toxin [Pseudoduganella aquatica]MYN09552.1 PIN domain-containing protein [Pseudoduganella aquatica]